jgi:hypothetical protein
MPTEIFHAATLERTCRWTIGQKGFAKAMVAKPPSLLMVRGGIDFSCWLSLSMIFGTSALSHCYKTKVPLLMCLAFVSLYRLTERSHE